MMRREQRSHALVTSPTCQIDGLVDVRQFGFDVGGGGVHVALHRPTAIIVRDGAGEHTMRVPSERPDYAKWALPVAAFAIVSMMARGRRRRHRGPHRRSTTL